MDTFKDRHCSAFGKMKHDNPKSRADIRYDHRRLQPHLNEADYPNRNPEKSNSSKDAA